MSESAQVMAYFFNNVDVFLLILIRLIGFFIILPILSGTSVPTVARLLLALSMAYIVFSSSLIIGVEYHPSVLGYGVLAAGEFLTGFLMAFVVYIVFSVIFFAGQLIDMQVGFSMVQVFDPITQMQVPIAGNLLFMLVCAILVQAGGLNAFISALFFSYDVMPMGHAMVLDNGRVVLSLIQLVGAYFIMGVQVAMPLVGSIFALDVALGLLVKSAPQMNIFVVGMPIKLLCGLGILYVIAPVFAGVYDTLFSQSMSAMMDIIRDLSP